MRPRAVSLAAAALLAAMIVPIGPGATAAGPTTPAPSAAPVGPSSHGVPGSLTPALAGSTPWVNRTPVNPNAAPGPRWAPAMAYDAADGYLVLFGGLGNGHGSLRDTWTWANGKWTNRTATSGAAPSGRYMAAMAYDSALGEVILFGGLHAGSYLSDTWAYGGGRWTALAPAGSPPGLVGAAMADDPDDGELVLFGGTNASGAAQGGTWTFNGTWIDRTANLTASPPAVADAGMTYDAALDATVLFGGSGNARAYNETWAFAAGNWTNLTATSGPAPGARTFAGLAYDAADGYDLLFGGYRGVLEFNDSWAYADGRWSPLHPGLAPSPRNAFAFGYSTGPGNGNATVVLLSGRPTNSGSSGSIADYWTYKVPLRAALTLTPPAIDQGGSTTIDLNASGGFPPYAVDWQSLPAGCAGPSVPGNFSCTPALSGNLSVVAQVTDQGGGVYRVPGATLRVNLLPKVSASGSHQGSAVPCSVQFSAAVSGGTAPFSYAWQFGDGTNGSTAAPTHVYNAPGEYYAVVTVTDAVGASNTSDPIHLIVTETLTVVATASTYVGVAPLEVSFHANVSGGAPPIRYNWSFGVPGAYDPVADPTYTFAAPGSYVVVLRIADGLGSSATATFNETVFPPLSAALTIGFPKVPTCANGSVLAVVQLTAAVQGGNPPYNETWTFNGSRAYGLAPTVTLPGGSVFPVNLTVTDALHDVARTTSGLRVPTTSCEVVAATGVPEGTLQMGEVAAAVLGAVIALEVVVLWRRRRTR